MGGYGLVGLVWVSMCMGRKVRGRAGQRGSGAVARRAPRHIRSLPLYLEAAQQPWPCRVWRARTTKCSQQRWPVMLRPYARRSIAAATSMRRTGRARRRCTWRAAPGTRLSCRSCWSSAPASVPPTPRGRLRCTTRRTAAAPRRLPPRSSSCCCERERRSTRRTRATAPRCTWPPAPAERAWPPACSSTGRRSICSIEMATLRWHSRHKPAISAWSSCSCPSVRRSMAPQPQPRALLRRRSLRRAPPTRHSIERHCRDTQLSWRSCYPRKPRSMRRIRNSRALFITLVRLGTRVVPAVRMLMVAAHADAGRHSLSGPPSDRTTVAVSRSDYRARERTKCRCDGTRSVACVRACVCCVTDNRSTLLSRCARRNTARLPLIVPRRPRLRH